MQYFDVSGKCFLVWFRSSYSYDSITTKQTDRNILMKTRDNDKNDEQAFNNYSINEKLLEGPTWPVENNFWNKLKNDYPHEVASINKSLIVLKSIEVDINEKTFNKQLDPYETFDKIFDPQEPNNQLRLEYIFLHLLNDSTEICIGVCHMLCGEALNRLNAARLLYFTGYFSRTFSCIRDMYECLRVAEVCRNSKQSSITWLKGKRVKWNKSYSFPVQIQENSKNNDFFNKYGTHAQYGAASLITSVATLNPEFNKWKEVEYSYLEYCLTCFAFLFIAIKDIFEYSLNTFADRIIINEDIKSLKPLLSLNLENIETQLKDFYKIH